MTVQQAPPPGIKIVLVVADGRSHPEAVNAAAILGATAGSSLGLALGTAATDATGTTYPSIVTTPIPVLTSDPTQLIHLFHTADETLDVSVWALTEVARRSRSYEAYVTELVSTPHSEQDLVAVLLAGPRNRVTKLTKRLKLLST